MEPVQVICKKCQKPFLIPGKLWEAHEKSGKPIPDYCKTCRYDGWEGVMARNPQKKYAKHGRGFFQT